MPDLINFISFPDALKKARSLYGKKASRKWLRTGIYMEDASGDPMFFHVAVDNRQRRWLLKEYFLEDLKSYARKYPPGVRRVTGATIKEPTRKAIEKYGLE